LQAGDGPGRGLGGEPLLLGLLESLHLSAGLRVVCAGVVEPDAQPSQLDLEGDPAEPEEGVDDDSDDHRQDPVAEIDDCRIGPVLAVLTFDDVEQGVKLANNTIYGLAAGIWTKDIQKAHRAAKAIRAGTVWINSYNFYDSGAPFGGFKASGFGRDLGREALDGYLETKTVWVGL